MNERDENGGLGLQAGELYYQYPDGRTVPAGTMTETITSAGTEDREMPDAGLPIGGVDMTAVWDGQVSLPPESDVSRLFFGNDAPGALERGALWEVLRRVAGFDEDGGFTLEATTADEAHPESAAEEFWAALNEAVNRAATDAAAPGAATVHTEFTPERFTELARRVAEVRNAPVGTTMVMPTRNTAWGRGRGYNLATFVVDEDAGMGHITIHTAEGDTITTDHVLAGEHIDRPVRSGADFNRRNAARPVSEIPALYAHCTHCNMFTGFRMFEQDETVFVHGVPFRYLKKHTYCERCRAEVSVPGIDEQNHKARKNAQLAI